MTAALPAERQEAYRASIPPAGSPSPTRSPASCTSSPRDAAGYISGAVIPVDGGLGMGH